MAPTMAEAVRHAGGWMFDRVMLGWDVDILVADHLDSRPSRILGAHAFDMDCALSAPMRTPAPRAIAVDADLYETDERVRQLVRDARDHGPTDVRMWSGRAEHGRSMRHQLSLAARAFKAHALAAAAAPTDTIDGTEQFWGAEVPRPPDLVPAA